MGNNGYTGQLVGPFKANEELYTKIKENANFNIRFVQHLGIQANVGDMIFINHELYEIGKTGTYEIGNTEIKSIYFQNDVDNNTIIDYNFYIPEE